jgi:hypothetical protein
MIYFDKIRFWLQSYRKFSRLATKNEDFHLNLQNKCKNDTEKGPFFAQYTPECA